MGLRCIGQLGLAENVNKHVLFAVLNNQQNDDDSHKFWDRDQWRLVVNKYTFGFRNKSQGISSPWRYVFFNWTCHLYHVHFGSDSSKLFGRDNQRRKELQLTPDLCGTRGNKSE